MTSLLQSDVNAESVLKRIELVDELADKLNLARVLFDIDSSYNHANRLLRRKGAATKQDADRLVERVVAGMRQTSFAILCKEKSLPYVLPDDFASVADFFLQDVGLEPTAVYSYANFDHDFWSFFDRTAPMLHFPTVGSWCNEITATMTLEETVERLRSHSTEAKNSILSSCPAPTLLFIDHEDEPPARATAMNIGQSYLRLRVGVATDVSHELVDGMVLSNIDVSIDLPEYNAIALEKRPGLSARIKEVYLAFQQWRTAEIQLDPLGNLISISPR